MKNISDNSLSELQCLLFDLNNLIDSRYRHVSHYLPNDVKTTLKKATDKAMAEQERRDDED